MDYLKGSQFITRLDLIYQVYFIIYVSTKLISNKTHVFSTNFKRQIEISYMEMLYITTIEMTIVKKVYTKQSVL